MHVGIIFWEKLVLIMPSKINYYINVNNSQLEVSIFTLAWNLFVSYIMTYLLGLYCVYFFYGVVLFI